MSKLARCSLATAAVVPWCALRLCVRGFSSTAYRRANASIFDNEPARPAVCTSIPGPRSQEAIKELDRVFDTRSLNMLVDYDKSRGNYIADVTATFFSMWKPLRFAQISSIPLGYNNPRLAEVASSRAMVSAIINRPALGNFPPSGWAETLRTGILRAAPKGLNQIFASTTGSDANETAYKAAFIWRRARDRGGKPFSAEELDSAMVNQPPGAPKYSILSFAGGFHGRLFGSLSTTHSKAIHKLDIPAFDWPVAPFPRLKYPLSDHVAENKSEEECCLQEVERIITSFHNPVVAAVIEPIQSEGGDNHASPSYFRRLREITKRHNLLLIVDEVQTGVGATGKFWAHEHWGLEIPPDMVTFSKKAQVAGFFYADTSLRPDKPYRQFNTWMGDPVRALLFREIYDEVERLGLVEKTAVVGKYLYTKLEQLAARYPGEIHNLRGKDRGTFLAWDSPRRDEVLKLAKTRGVHMGGCGETTVRLRPMLIFQEEHVQNFRGWPWITYGESQDRRICYIGGQVLRELTRAHPGCSIAALIRNNETAGRISDAFPKVRTVVGDLDDAELVEREASQASVVLPYWIQISGASGLAAPELASPSFAPGSASSVVYDDLTGIEDIRALVRAYLSRAVNNYLLDVAAQTPSIKTALVWPPVIYGAGEGPVNQRSIQVPTLARATLERGHPVKVAEGLNRWGNIHVRDLGRLICSLVYKALRGDQRQELWGENGIYLAVAGEMSFAELSERISRAALEQKLINSEQIEALEPSSADTVLPYATVFYGTNARGKARRASELLGWNPHEEPLETDVPIAVAEEAKRRAQERGD
ncbi:hypothetical protein DL768_008991 [Monosporascus sp. mg162]|nr:hypothetical protein DL768_008991 [Monosporascus sp. mg162]